MSFSNAQQSVREAVARSYKCSIDEIPCKCMCHVYPGTYPTSLERPCSVCHHVNSEGRMIGTIYDGWIKHGIEPWGGE